PSPVAGVLTEIKAAEGETVQINVVVAVIGGSGEAPIEIPSGQPSTEHGRTSSAGDDSGAQASLTSSQVVDPERRLRSSPLVRRIAKEHNIDLRLVPGSGSEGRINKE